METITTVLMRNAELYGDDVCLVEVDPSVENGPRAEAQSYNLFTSLPVCYTRREITWLQFQKASNQIANLLLARGLGKQRKVAILLVNCLEWLPIYFGVLKAGAVAVPLNYRYTAEEIRYCLDLVQADTLIFGPEFVERVAQIQSTLPQVKQWFYLDSVLAPLPDFAESFRQLAAAHPTLTPPVTVRPEDDAAIYFSSGTTGFPKAILHPHSNLYFSCVVEQRHHGQTRDDCFLCIPPLYHTGAKMHWFGSFLVGGKAVLLKGAKPEWILQTISDEKVTIVWLLVPWAQDILDAIERGDVNLNAYQLDQWRLMHIGAQPVPPSLVNRWLKYFPHHQYDTNYGLTESTGPGCVHLGIENVHKVGAIGIPGYMWEAKIVDERGEEVAAGQVGELIVKGPGVMKEYFRDPKATAATIKDGWLYTGDMARMDKDGFIYLVDRKKDVIITGGENIYPVEIEDFLRHHDAVKDVAVIGLPDRRLGEIAAAIVETKPGYNLTEEEILAFCEALPRYKRPRKVIFDQVPRNATGKIEKPKLRQKYVGKESIVEAEIELNN